MKLDISVCARISKRTLRELNWLAKNWRLNKSRTISKALELAKEKSKKKR